MQDLTTDKVVLLKAVRRKSFTLGKCPALASRDIVEMTDGSVWSVAYRRPDWWDYNPKAALTVAFRMTYPSDFNGAVEFMRETEAQFITAELPEVAA